MREKLLEILVEPVTGSALRLEVSRHAGTEIEEGALVSEQSGRRYAIVRGIPRFVPEASYADNFGMQWNKFREAQVDSATQGTHSRARFDAETGWTEDDLRGKWLLDAGCGAGRFAEIAAARGPNLVAMDLSSAVEAARTTLARFHNVDVVQGSILEPPFRTATFDYAYCIGVIQHTPDPSGAVTTVASLVKPGGGFAFTIYARRPWTKLYAKYLIRPITRRMKPELLLRGIEAAMPVLFPITERLFRLPVLGKAGQFVIPVANYVDRTEFTYEQRYREAILDTFDMLSPRYDSPMVWNEVDTALKTLGAHSWEFRSRVPISCVGRR